MNKEITLEQLASYETAFDGDRANRIAMDAATKNGVNNAAVRFENAREMRHTFNISLEQGDITNQKQSGRCWMFAALNTMRFRIIKKLGVKTFELSQNYALFFDKLEKSNYFLESILETLDEPTAGRLVTYLLSGPLGDGGQWDMFANLVEKYGVVPKEVMPETAASSSTQKEAAPTAASPPRVRSSATSPKSCVSLPARCAPRIRTALPWKNSVQRRTT